MKTLIPGLICLAFCSVILADEPAGHLIINEDNSHFFGSRDAADMSLQGLHAFVDQYADTQVSHLFLCPNAMRANFQNSARAAIWELPEDHLPLSENAQRWVDNAKRLHDQGLDPYSVWIARAREKNISPWLSMRMNDVHDSPHEKNFMHSPFWREHPQFWRVPHAAPGSWTNRALDYGHPEVRKHAMDFIRVLLERYDPDGLELDWMRFGWHFQPGHEAEGAEILTAFMRDVRELTQQWSRRRGHRILVGARVPADPDAARGLGMDGARWAREGLVDMLVPTPFWTTTDFDIPVEHWRQQIGPVADSLVIAPGIEHNSRAWPGGAVTANDLAATRGFAASAWHRGADLLYLFNYMDSQTRPVSADDYRTLLMEGLASQSVARRRRRHIQTFRDTVPAGVSSGICLPSDAESSTFLIPVGVVPPQRRVSIVAGFADRPGVAEAEVSASLNDRLCGKASNQPHAAAYPGAARAVLFVCPSDAVVDGHNRVTIHQSPGQQLVWVEIEIAGD